MTLNFYYGDEDFLLFKEIKDIKQRFIQGNSDLALEEFDNKKSVESLIEALFSVNMFVPRKLIIFYGLPEVREDYVEHFQKLIADLPQGNDLFFVYRGSPDKRKKNVKWLISVSNCKEFKKLEIWNKDQFFKYVQDMIKTDQFEIENKAMEYLVELIGLDLWSTYTNLEKIKTAILPRKKITLQDIDNYAAQGEKNIFDVLDFFRKKNKRQLFEYILNMKKQEEAFILLSTMSKHVRFLMQLKSYNTNNLSDIIKASGKAPFYVKKIVPDLKYWSFKELKTTLVRINELDYLSKSGKINITVGLENIIAQI
ncbi:MAG: DNA polymerase III subunit delta [Candidatus Margulisbacteria bacterium]|nr:DNA polymerase III subunit delta [Candidatus Margulisiibacteriota bacterium]